MKDLVPQIRKQGCEVICLVQPSLRRRSNKTLWVSRWNQLQDADFQFKQTCSCKLSNCTPGCHFAVYVGSTVHLPHGPCDYVPTLAALSSTSKTSLRGSVKSLVSAASGTCSAVLNKTVREGCLENVTRCLGRDTRLTGSQQLPITAVPLKQTKHTTDNEKSPLPVQNNTKE